MRKFTKSLLIGILGSLFCNSAKADFDHYSITSPSSGQIDVYTCLNSTGVCTNKASYNGLYGGWAAGTTYVDKENNLIIHGIEGGAEPSRWLKYDMEDETISEISDWKDNYSISLEKNLISSDSNGITSIGKNSLKLKETATEQQLWGTNSSGQIVPINITNGSKLLINGRDVEQSINNVGALSAALTGLPTVPTDTTLACGFGTGTHGGDFAFSGGCASKVNEKLSFNYAASMTMPGQDYAGNFEDKFSARAGFVWKLGKSNTPTQISLNESRKLKTEVKDLKMQNDQLLARLEKLEKLTLALKLNPESKVLSLAK